MRRLLFSLLAALVPLGASLADTVKPWTFWYWMYGAVSEEGIRADLKAMKDVGLGGCYLMPIRGAAERPEFGGTADALSSNFWQRVDLALQQADSLGLGLGIHVCDGFALAGGPWITPAESMQRVVFCDTVVAAGHHRFLMPKPRHNAGYYEDIGLYAIPVEGGQQSPLNARRAPTTSPAVTVNAKGVYCADEPAWIQYEFSKPTLVRSIEIEPSGTNIQCQRLLVKSSNDGRLFYTVKQLTPPRQGWQNTGFNTTFSIPPTKAKFFRFEWTPEGTEPGAEDLDAAKWKPVLRLKGINMYSWPLIDNWEGKSGAVWRIAPDTPEEDIPGYDFLRPADIVYGKVQHDGTVDITLPTSPGGAWRILRMGHTSTGHTNATAGGAKGLECDKFSAAAVAKQVDSWFGQFMQRPNHRAIQYMHVDSWECGSQNWSSSFATEFERRRGYDLLPLLPVYAGVPMRGGDAVLRDIRLTINELTNEAFFTTVAQKARQYGVQLSSESVAPTMVSDGMEHYKYVDVPMGEYWLNSPTHDKPNDMLDAISGAHVYGKNIVQAEGFTEVRGVWDETPAGIKPLLDRNFCLGMNRLFFHVFTHNPWTGRKPGMTLDGIGLFFQRDQTWFPEAKGLVDYVTRCQRLLQQGKPVVDIAVFTGEEMPSRALTPDRLVPLLPGLFGPERVKAEQQRLANAGQPMEESPVGVRHSAGILDLKDWINPLHGYHYDSMNKDALLSQPFNYKVLVVPPSPYLSKETREKLAELRMRGVTVLHEPYVKPVLKEIAPDIILLPADGQTDISQEALAYAHRHAEGRDIYFLSNQQAEPMACKASFRCGGQKAALYNPVTDETTAAAARQDRQRTVVDIKLPPYGSCFVLFGEESNATAATDKAAAAKDNATAAKDNAAAATEDVTRELPGTSWTVSFRESGVMLADQQLFDWSKHPAEPIRYFSGHARYTTTLKLKAKDVPAGRTRLVLPGVRDIAHVWVNGRDCGLAWTAPYEVDITGALKKGKNTLEIEVVNTWHNALRGLDQGKAPYDGIWTNARYRTKGDDLLPAGLLATPQLRIETK